MSTKKSRAQGKFPVEKLSGWDGPIAEAKQRIQELEFSLRVFEQKKAAGEPCHGIPQSDFSLVELATT
jgi:hypothetical protein